MASYDEIVETGVIIADTSETLNEVQDEYKQAFNDSNLETDPSTPQGVLIVGETSSRQTAIRRNAALANQINPNIAGGIFLDAIWKFNGGERDDASKTIVSNVTLTGVPGTTIPVLSKAETGSGDVFETLSTVQLNGGGEALVNFQSEQDGPIPCSAGQLTTVVSDVIGWETVNNSQDGVLGGNEQSDVSARRERRQTIALQGRSLTEAISSNVRFVDGVESLRILENKTPNPVIIENVNLIANSIWICVDGGTDTDIAEAINEAKSGGCGYNGAVAVVVQDPTSMQPITINFDRPTEVPVLIRATVTLVGSVTNAETAIRNAILDYANGLIDNFEGFTVGNNVSPNQISQAIGAVIDGVFINSMEVSLDAPINYVFTEIPLEIFEQASTQSGDITVNIL